MGRESRQTRRARERRQQSRQQARSSPTRWSVVAGAAVIVAVLVVLIAFVFGKSLSASGSSVNATATAQAEFTPVAGLAAGPARCSFNEMTGAGFYHVHAHLTLLDRGKQVTIPANIGFEYHNDCLYWVHTHSPSYGIIHIESPYKIVPTLGDFFKIWGVPLSSSRAWKYSGPMKVYVNLKPYRGNPRSIPLRQHTDVTIEVGGSFRAPKRFDFAAYQV